MLSIIANQANRPVSSVNPELEMDAIKASCNVDFNALCNNDLACYLTLARRYWDGISIPGYRGFMDWRQAEQTWLERRENRKQEALHVKAA